MFLAPFSNNQLCYLFSDRSSTFPKSQDINMKKKDGSRGKPLKEGLFYTVEVTDKEGHILQLIEAPSRSYVQQWNQVVNVQAKQTALTIKDTGGGWTAL